MQREEISLKFAIKENIRESKRCLARNELATGVSSMVSSKVEEMSPSRRGTFSETVLHFHVCLSDC